MAAVPPCVTHVLRIVAFAVGKVVSKIVLAAVCRERLDVGVFGYRAVDIVAPEAGRNNVGVKSVEKIIGLIWKRRRCSSSEVALLGKGHEFACICHNRGDSIVQIVLDCGDEVA